MDKVLDHVAVSIGLSKAKGMHAPVVREMLERIGNASDFFLLSQSQLHNLTGINSSAFTDSYRQSLLAEAEKEAQFTRDNHIDVSFIDSKTYPSRLSNCDDAPVLLYKLGSCDLESAHMVGIVGTRHATMYGIDFTTRLVADLAKKLDSLVIVSGLAYGIDVAAHKAAISNGVPTVGVLAHGLNMIYPADHRAVAAKMLSSGGALISEYSSTDLVHRHNFLERNRIVAGLCDCLIVVESDYRGGSMATARIASQYNRDVFAVPGRVSDRYSHGTNQLIASQTATLLTDASQLIEYMQWQTKQDSQEASPTLFRALSPDEQQLIDFIQQHPEATINDICVRMNKSYSFISNMLVQLEMDDLIITLPGGRYSVVAS